MCKLSNNYPGTNQVPFCSTNNDAGGAEVIIICYDLLQLNIITLLCATWNATKVNVAPIVSNIKC